MDEIIIPITLFISMAITLILFRKFTNDERLALIEKGVDVNVFNKKPFSFPSLRIGLLLFGGGLGILTGSILSENSFLKEEPAIFSCILLFGGLGLFMSFFVENYLRKKKSED